MEASGGPTTCPADPAAVVIPSAKDLFPGDVALPTTAKIGPNHYQLYRNQLIGLTFDALLEL